MGDSEIYRQLNKIFNDVFQDDDMIVGPDLSATEVTQWDSLGHVRLILTVEKVFRIKFLAAEAGNIRTAGELAQLIQKKL